MRIFKTCRTISVTRFYEVLESKDKKYLIEDWENTEITKELKADLQMVWNQLFREYIELKDDKEIRLSFRQLALIDKLEKKLLICKSLLEGLVMQSTKKGQLDYIKELSAWGFPINRRKNLNSEVQKVINSLKTLRSTISIKKTEFEKTHKKEMNEEKFNLDREIVNVEQALGKNSINPDTTPLSRWIEYKKKAIEIGEKYKKQVA